MHIYSISFFSPIENRFFFFVVNENEELEDSKRQTYILLQLRIHQYCYL